jgi:ppGpp synthetase/RelA/SpoT-type nucleotidyltranferase
MTKKEKLDPKTHQEQIQAYTTIREQYKIFAAILHKVLEQGCKPSISEAIVQTRAKTISSFAEKCARKYQKYKDPVNQFTDLCGARVIVQTLEQVSAVEAFVKENFIIQEKEDKGLLLETDRFGYRDMHFIIQLKPGHLYSLSDEESEKLPDLIDLKAELQVRTWLQHAWADILHDRIYKAPLHLSAEIKRAGNLLAAVMEEGDRGFDRLALDLDGMHANYTAYASAENVQEEIDVLTLLEASADEKNKPRLALKLARLIAIQSKWARIIELLEPHVDEKNLTGLEICSELGYALCRQNRAKVNSNQTIPDDYTRGQKYLLEVIHECENTQYDVVPNLRKLCSIHARANARLGWSYEPLEADAFKARRYYARAAELEPENPYYLTDMLGFEFHFSPETELLSSFRATIRKALQACLDHARAGTELPAAFFAAGRLYLLLDEPGNALEVYARGVRYCRANEGIYPRDVMEREIDWLIRINPGRQLLESHQWVKDLLTLGLSAPDFNITTLSNDEKSSVHHILIIAGGAQSLSPDHKTAAEEFIYESLADYQGVVISGGTTSGIPGAVGAAAERLDREEQRKFKLLGYLPQHLPRDAEQDIRYDQLIPSGANMFSAGQVLDAWLDILSDKKRPLNIQLLGFGGGAISAFEYRLALAMGATVGLVSGMGGASDEIFKDPLWENIPDLSLFPLPADAKTLRAFVLPDGVAFDENDLKDMAQAFHNQYRQENRKKIQPDTLKDWDILPPTYIKANKEQAAYAIRILNAAGFDVVKVKDEPVPFTEFTKDEINLMAELEHGRWNIERLHDGWRPGHPRDDARKIHDCLVPWSELPDNIKQYDIDAVKAFPEILAKAKMEIRRPGMEGKGNE